jgi:hypothetical protein
LLDPLLQSSNELMNTLLAQGSPWGASPYGPDPQPASLPIGAFVIAALLGLGLQVLFGLWGKSRAEDHGVLPLYGFLAGFFLGWIGVAIVPILKTNRVVNTRQPLPYPPPHYPPPQTPYPQASAQPLGAWQPPPAPDAMPHHFENPQQPPPQQVTPQQPVLTPDKDGYAQCPACGARVKVGRRSCMSCGAALS